MMSVIGRRYPAILFLGACAILGLGWFFLASSGEEGRLAGDSGNATPHLRRLTETQYRQTIADIFGADIKIAGRFEPDMRVDGLLAAGTGKLSITPSGMEQYENIALTIAAQVVDPSHRDRLVGCTPGASDPAGETCARRFLSGAGKKLFRRPLTSDELRLAVENTMAASKQLGNFHAGLAAGLSGLMTAPEFLFQVENPVPGRARLDSWSKATRLSFFLWNSTPDDQLLAAAEHGDLDTAAGLRRQANRLIDSPRFQEGVRAFFADFLQFEDLDTVTKDPVIYPAFTASVIRDAREQTLKTIVDQLIVGKGDYRDLFTSRRMAMNRTLGALYRIPVTSKDWSVYEFPDDDPRGGLLTQISFLALNAHPGRTSPTLRGKAIREVLMCEKVPAPPANVNFTIVQDTGNPLYKTTRSRVQAHLGAPTCAGCHKLMDPQGLALENFDGAGQYRGSENGTPIDPTGALDGASFSGARALGQALHDNPAVPRCLVNSVYRYGVGREIKKEDGPAVSALLQGFAADGYRLADLMRDIATSPAFYSVSNQEPASTSPQKEASR